MHSLTASTSVSNVSLTTNNRVTEEMDVTLVSGANHTAALPVHHLHDEDLSTGTSLIVYVSLLLVFSTLVMVRTLLYVHVCTKASTSLHDFMFHSVLRAVVEFFDDNPSGRVLNRFSKDLGAVDEIFPQKLLHTLQVLLVLFGSLITIAIVSYVCVVPMFLLGILIYCICIVYIRTGQSIKRLEATTCSPVFSHVSMTLSGVTTIRASRAQEMVSKQFHSHQDVNTSAIHLSLAAEYAFALWIDMSVSFYVAVIIISFFIFGESDAGNVALAVVQALSLMGRLQFTTCMMSEVTTHMTSVQRVLQYADISTEENLQSETGHKPQDSWPSKGAIQFDHVSVKYSSMDPPVLDDISLNIEPGQKVGIVGRTGAGKSSLISGLFRLAQLEGCIRIDQVDIRSMGLHDLRSHISIIPQEPVLFTTSLRNNLDPLHSHSDAELWSVLHEVELGTSVKTLDAVIATEGSHFSSGQRQLICLARAILRNNKILIMDEATANVDPQTDALIQATIRRKFKDCTVLTIAHRLSTILDSDRVLVLDAGSMVEFGDPHTLLQNHEGYFYKMVQEESESENSRLPRQYSTVDDI